MNNCECRYAWETFWFTIGCRPSSLFRLSPSAFPPISLFRKLQHRSSNVRPFNYSIWKITTWPFHRCVRVSALIHLGNVNTLLTRSYGSKSNGGRLRPEGVQGSRQTEVLNHFDGSTLFFITKNIEDLIYSEIEIVYKY